LLVVNPVNISPFPAVIRLSLDTEDAGGHWEEVLSFLVPMIIFLASLVASRQLPSQWYKRYLVVHLPVYFARILEGSFPGVLLASQQVTSYQPEPVHVSKFLCHPVDHITQPMKYMSAFLLYSVLNCLPSW
jgi:hypothetical protein